MRPFSIVMPVLCGLALAAAVSNARAEPADRWIRAFALERGCYLMRGRQICARYCYIEADGHRYCRDRQRDAVSQAPYVAATEEPPVPVK